MDFPNDQLYVLALTERKYYVGVSASPLDRYEQHKAGIGAEWTKLYPPKKILSTHPVTSADDENNLTRKLMREHGIDNVRGGSYVQVHLPKEFVSTLEAEFRGATNACFVCGTQGHYAKECPTKTAPCSRCDRAGHTPAKCDRYTNSAGGYIGKPPALDVSDSSSDEEEAAPKMVLLGFARMLAEKHFKGDCSLCNAFPCKGHPASAWA